MKLTTTVFSLLPALALAQIPTPVPEYRCTLAVYHETSWQDTDGKRFRSSLAFSGHDSTGNQIVDPYWVSANWGSISGKQSRLVAFPSLIGAVANGTDYVQVATTRGTSSCGRAMTAAGTWTSVTCRVSATTGPAPVISRKAGEPRWVATFIPMLDGTLDSGYYIKQRPYKLPPKPVLLFQ